MILSIAAKVLPMVKEAGFKTRAMSAKDWGQIVAVVAAISAGWAKIEGDVEHMRSDIARIERNLELITKQLTKRE